MIINNRGRNACALSDMKVLIYMSMQIFDSYKLFFVIVCNISNKCTYNISFNLYMNKISKLLRAPATNKKQRLSYCRNNR